MGFKSRRERFFKVSAFFLMLAFVIVFISSASARRRVIVFFSPACINRHQPVSSNKLTDRIADYSAAAKLTGITPCKNEKAIRQKAQEGKLVHIRGGRNYEIDRLTHSYPYLTKNAESLLHEIGLRFRQKTNKEGLRGSVFIVTSLTRTTEKLKDLRRNNSVASANSPHLYGNAFDISYVRFKSRKLFVTECDRKFFKEVLAEIILELRRENSCWATYERQQSCFHIVAR